MSDNDDIEITAEGVKVHASEKVSTGQYESGTVSATLELDVNGVDVSDGLSHELRERINEIRRGVQDDVEQAAHDRKRRAESGSGW